MKKTDGYGIEGLQEVKMKKEELTELGISKDIADKVLMLYDEKVKEVKIKLNELENQLKAANATLNEKNIQLRDMKKNQDEWDDLKKRLTELKEENKRQKAEYEAELGRIRLNAAVDAALAKAGARNIKAVKALLNMEEICLGEKGEAMGLDKQLTELKKGEDTGFLFGANEVSGFVPGEGEMQQVDPSKMNYAQLCAYMEANPGASIM